jgi:hypothetical protein
MQNLRLQQRMSQPARDYLVASQKASDALFETIAAEKIENWYLLQGKRVHVNWNQATDIGRKGEFDIAIETGRVFVEECLATTSRAVMVMFLISPFGYILPRLELLEIPAIGEAERGDFNLSRGHFISLEGFQDASDAL